MVRISEVYGAFDRPREISTDQWLHVPGELQSLEQWVIWRWEVRDGKRTKAPYNAGHPTSRASSTDPETWRPFDLAVRCAAETPSVAGIGFVFAPDDPYCGIDFDHCLGPDGTVAGWADRWLRDLGGYQEISPSRTGIKVIVRARVIRGRKTGNLGDDGAGGCEVYSGARFFTITGDLHDSEPIEDRQPVVDALLSEVFPRLAEKKAKEGQARILPLLPDDDALIDRARMAKNGEKFRALYDRGDWQSYYPSRSEADAGLCQMVAFWTGPDPDRIDRIFRRSSLMRPKWDAMHGDYTIGERAIDHALSHVGETFGSRKSQSVNGAKHRKHSGPDDARTFNRSNEFTGTRNIREWPEPLSLEPMPAVPFPLEVLPIALADYCSASAEGMECPVDYFAAPMVVLAGAALGLSVRLEIEPGFRVPASLYLGVVGPPGTRKSPAIERVAGPLWDIDSEYRKLHKDDKIACKGDDEAEPKPFRQLCVDDVTRESIAPILEVNPRGLALIKDELTGWVLSQNAYKKGLGDDKQFWMSVNSCKAIKVNRKGAPDAAIVVPRPFISVVGALTPENMPVIRSDKRDDGWLDRILFSYPEPLGIKPWRRGKVAPDHGAWKGAVMRLRGILGADPAELDGLRHIDLDEFDRPSPRLVRMTDDATDAWEIGVNAHREEQWAGDFDPNLVGPWSKMEGYAGRLALILGHLRLACHYQPGVAIEPTDIDARAVRDAWTLTSYFKAHHVRARGELADGANGGDDHGRRIAAWLTLGLAGELELGRHFDEQSTAEVKTFAWAYARRRFPRWPEDVLRAGLSWLERRHVIAVAEGREARTIYGVNPRWEAQIEKNVHP